ncbi:hypothetical protein LINGRAHAP2_LOCUS2058 [Linum grandiflorum]
MQTRSKMKPIYPPSLYILNSQKVARNHDSFPSSQSKPSISVESKKFQSPPPQEEFIHIRVREMSGKGPTIPKSPSTRNRSKAKAYYSSQGTKLKKEITGLPSLSGTRLETAKTPVNNNVVVQCGGIGETVKLGGRHKKKKGGGGKKHKVVESWKWIKNNNNKSFSPRQQQNNKSWLEAEQGMTFYLKWDEGLVETQDWKLGQNCFICGRDLSYAPIPPETDSGTYNFPEVAVLACGHVFHMICFSSSNQSTDPSCFKCSPSPHS